MSLFNASLSLYRKTVKRLKPAHLALHWLMSHTLLPALEHLKGFRTMPDDPFWFRFELLIGQHERATTYQIEKLVKPGMTVLDIGAHVGYYSRRLARLVGRQGRVLAFEPHPRIFATLEINLRRFENVIPLQMAVSDVDGKAELHDYLMMSASGSLHYDEGLRRLQQASLGQSDVAPRIAQNFPSQTFSVPTTRVDTCLANLGIETVDVIKMDIEGAEIRALQGMSETIVRSPSLVLVMEYNPQALRASGADPVEAVRRVLSMGFRNVRAIEEDASLTDFTPGVQAMTDRVATLAQSMGVVNLLFTR